MFRLAQVSDPHFRSFAGAMPSDFFGKRAIGALNLLVNRGRKHRMALLDALRDDLRVQGAEHLVMTGDLSNLSLPGEWATARRWIDRYGAAQAVTVIPGNHDAYVAGVVEQRLFEKAFASFQTAEVRLDEDTYPFARVREGVAIVGVNTCLPTGDLGAWGRIGETQLGRIERLLAAPELRDSIRVVAMHHPPVIHRGGDERNLRDHAAFAAVIARVGAELVLHGHDHRDERAKLVGPGGAQIPVIGCGSASYDGSADRRSRYNIFEIDGRAITLCTRSHVEASNEFREVRRERLG